MGRACKTYRPRPICSAHGTKNPLPLGMGSVNWEACDINKISPLELENPDFIYSIDKYMNDHDLLEILSNDEIIFYDPEMPEIIYNAVEPRNKKNAMCLIMNTWPMDEAFLERYYSEMRDFSRYTSFIALNPVQKTF